jgi:hypothetical protein
VKPSELANSLRRIATAIDASKKPDRRLVARDLKKIIASVNPSVVTIKEFNYDSGDKRSYGDFYIVAETSLGELIGKGMIGSGSDTQDEVWTLNGKPIDETIDYPDLGIPHYYAGSRSISRFEKVKDTEIPEAISEWVNDYIQANSELNS